MRSFHVIIAVVVLVLGVRAQRGLTLAYRGAQVSLVGTAAYDMYETTWGLRHTKARETGEASWFVNPHSVPEVVAFNLGEDALVLCYGHWASRRSSAWLRWSGVGLLAMRSWFHISGGRSWARQPRRGEALYQEEW